MRRYVIGLALIALLIGSLFRAAEQTGVGLMKMFGTLGILLFGVVGTMALTRWQSRSGLKEIEQALKSLEPEWFITDWAYQEKEKPDYLLVGPGGIVAICLSDVAQSTRARRAASAVAAGRQRVTRAMDWVRQRLRAAAPELEDSLGEAVRELPVAGVLVLTRRRAEEEYSTPEVPVRNPERVVETIRSLWDQERLDRDGRIRLTRLFRGG